ncbi:MAG: transketolase [bacterium]
MPAQNLQLIANELRAKVLAMARSNFNLHLAGPMSSADLFATLYFGDILKYHPEDPWNEDRDRLILSCGHYVPILYAALAKAGFFPKEKLASFAQPDGLPVHPESLSDRSSLPGIEASTGPLGQGMSVAVGIAKALKLKRNMHSRVYCVCSDGELQEGQAWEAIGLSVREKLDNITWLIDANNIQIEHFVTELAGHSSLIGKFEAWGCHTLLVDGNNAEKLQELLQRINNNNQTPTAIVLKTIGGKGVSFMENTPKWHDGRLTDEQYEQAIRELGI